MMYPVHHVAAAAAVVYGVVKFAVTEEIFGTLGTH